MDIAQLGLRIDNAQITQAVAELGKLGTQASNAEGRVRSWERAQNDASRATRAHHAAVRAEAEAYQQVRPVQVAATTAIIQSTEAVEKAHVSYGRFQNAIANLGLQAIGIQGPLQKIVETIAVFGVGTVWVTGVLAGIAAIAAAYHALTVEARETVVASNAAKESIDKLFSTRRLELFQQQEAIVKRIAIAEKELATAQQGRRLGGKGGLIVSPEEVTKATNALREWHTELDRLHILLGRETGSRTISDLERDFAGLQRAYAGGFLDEAGLKRLQAIKAAIGGIAGSGETTLAGRDRLKALLDQVTKVFEAQEKVAGQWTKLSGGPIQQMLTDLERAAEVVPILLQGIKAVGSVPGAVGQPVEGPPGGGTYPYTPQFLLGRYSEDGINLAEKHRLAAKDVSVHWADTARSVAQLVQLLGVGNDSTALMLQNLVTGASQLEKITSAGGKAATGDVLGLATSLLTVFSGLFGGGETAAQRQSREIQKQNTEAVKQLTSVMEAGITGNQLRQAGQATGALIGGFTTTHDPGVPGFSNPSDILNSPNVDAILAGMGYSFGRLDEFAKTLNVTLDRSTAYTFLESLKQLKIKMDQLALVTIKGFGGQLDLLNRQWALAGTGPIDKLRGLIEAIQNPESGAPGLGGLGGFDIGTAGGRNQANEFLKAQLAQIQAGTFDTTQLGGLTLQQYLDFISQFGALLNEANQAMEETVKNLRAFADSLKLDSTLSTLSPVQKLAEARRQYDVAYTAAASGDTTAAGNLPALARAFLEASRAFNASNPAYAADFAQVLRQTEEIASQFAAQTAPGGPGDITPLIEPIIHMDDNMGQILVEQQATVAVLKEGLQQAVDKLDELVTQMAENNRYVKLGLE